MSRLILSQPARPPEPSGWGRRAAVSFEVIFFAPKKMARNYILNLIPSRQDYTRHFHNGDNIH